MNFCERILSMTRFIGTLLLTGFLIIASFLGNIPCSAAGTPQFITPPTAIEISDTNVAVVWKTDVHSSEQIVSQPFSGRKVPEYQTEDLRELIEKPCRIIYRVKRNQIDVLAVIHGAQILPEEIE